MKMPKFFPPKADQPRAGKRRIKRNLWIIAILIVIILGGGAMFKGKGSTASIQTGFATKQNLEETVLTTGQVFSGTDLSLSFQGSGIVRKILVKEGDRVSQGQTLAYLDQSSAMATLTSAQGSLAQAQANYEKLLAGATTQNIQTVKDSIASAKQDLDNAYNGSLNTLTDAYTKAYNAYAAAVSLQGSYFSTFDQQGIKVQDNKNIISSAMADIGTNLNSANSNADIDTAIYNISADLKKIYDSLKIIRDQCDDGVYYLKVSSADKATIDTQKININTASTNVSNLQHSIASYKIALQKAEDQLNVTTAPPTQAEIDLAKAQILSAQGQVDSAKAVLSNMVVVAPLPGTITSVDIKVGEQATSMKEVFVLQDIGDLHAEADVSEANIASLMTGQTIDYTFDALGPDQHFSGKVLTINPSSTVISGVVNYKVKGSLSGIEKLKPGMTANMTILVAQKNDALAVSSTAVINKNNKYYVRVIDDSKNKTYHEVEVKTGLRADGGLIEIISGISDGQEIITYMK